MHELRILVPTYSLETTIQKREYSNGQTTSYGYDESGNRKTVLYPNGATEGYSYYRNHSLKELVNQVGGNVVDNYSYTYDGANNQLTKTEKKGTTTYTYDSLNRLGTVVEPEGKSTSYSYDRAGNRTSETVTADGKTQSTKYTYNSQNRLMETTTQQINGTEKTSFAYDGNGNLLTKTTSKLETAGAEDGTTSLSVNGKDGKNVTTYRYDELNQMIQTIEGKNVLTYRYNGEGKRTEKTVNGKTTRYLYEADQVILEEDGAGNQIGRNVQGMNTLARTVDGQTMYYLYNGHGDVTGLLNGAGELQATYRYDAFGNVTEQTGAVRNSISFAGYQRDEETGLYYLNARMYDPAIARFLQEDTYRGQANDPLSLNLYSYCANEPVMYSDPTGHTYNPNEHYNDQWEADREWQADVDRGDKDYDGVVDSEKGVADKRNEDYDDGDDDGVPDYADSESNHYMDPNAKPNNWDEISEILASVNQLKSSQAIETPYNEWEDSDFTFDLIADSGTVTSDSTSALIGELSSKFKGVDGKWRRVTYDPNAFGPGQPGLVLNDNGKNIAIMRVNGDLLNLKPEDVTREVAATLVANPGFVFAAQHPDITAALTGEDVRGLFYAAGFTIDDNGVFHARQEWSIQSFKYSGYNDFYNTVFRYATNMKDAQFQFYDKKGNNYILWAWKGDYLNLGAGAEMGIYRRMIVNGKSTDHWIVDKNLAMPMTLTLRYNGKPIISYDPKSVDPKIFDPLRKSTDKWWVTGFNPAYQDKKAGELTATFSIDFTGRKELYDAFINSDDFINSGNAWSQDKNSTLKLYFNFK